MQLHVGFEPLESAGNVLSFDSHLLTANAKTSADGLSPSQPRKSDNTLQKTINFLAEKKPAADHHCGHSHSGFTDFTRR